MGLAVLLASLASSTGVAGDVLADGTVARGEVAYTRTTAQGEGSWITVADLAGAGHHEITPQPAKKTPWKDHSPLWSPDGSWLAFLRDRPNSRSDLFVAKRDGTGLQHVLRLPYEYEYDTSYFSWSPDGQWLAFADGPLFLVRRDGTNSRKLLAASACKPAWMPDGKSLVYLVDDSCGGRGSNEWVPGHRGIDRIDTDGSGRRRLAAGSFGDAASSPDGHQIAYTDRCEVAHGGDWACSASLMRADGGGKRRLVKDTWGGGDWGVAWAAGGKEVLSPSYPAIQATNIETGKSRKVLPASYEGTLVGISRSGARIAVLLKARSYESRYVPPLVVATVNGRLVQRVPVPTGWYYEGASVFLR